MSTNSAKTISGETTSTGGGGGGTGTADNISGGSAGQVPYQSGASTTTFTNSGDGVLQSNGSLVSFSALSLTGSRVTGVLPLTKGGTGSSTLTGVTGTGKIVADTSPTLITPTLITPNFDEASGSTLTLTNTGNIVSMTSTTDSNSFNLSGYHNSLSNFYIGQGTLGFPGVGSNVDGTGVLTTSGVSTPIDIVPNGQPSLTAKIDGKLKFYQHQNGSFLRTDSTGNVEAILAPTFRAYMGSPAVFFGGSVTTVPINTIVFSRNTGFNTSTHEFKPTVAGYYQCSAFIDKQVNTGEFFLFIIKNGTDIVTQTSIHAQQQATFQQYLNCSGLTYLNGTTDYIEMVFQTTVNVTVPPGDNETVFMASLIP